MPVQINEVIIRTVVDATPMTTSAAATATTPGGGASQEEILERVLQIIEEEKER